MISGGESEAKGPPRRKMMILCGGGSPANGTMRSSRNKNNKKQSRMICGSDTLPTYQINRQTGQSNRQTILRTKEIHTLVAVGFSDPEDHVEESLILDQPIADELLQAFRRWDSSSNQLLQAQTKVEKTAAAVMGAHMACLTFVSLAEIDGTPKIVLISIQMGIVLLITLITGVSFIDCHRRKKWLKHRAEALLFNTVREQRRMLRYTNMTIRCFEAWHFELDSQINQHCINASLPWSSSNGLLKGHSIARYILASVGSSIAAFFTLGYALYHH